MLFAQVRMLWPGCFDRRSRHFLLLRRRVGGVMGVAASAGESTAAVQRPVEGAHSCRPVWRPMAGATAPALNTRLSFQSYMLVCRAAQHPGVVSSLELNIQVLQRSISAYSRKLRCTTFYMRPVIHTPRPSAAGLAADAHASAVGHPQPEPSDDRKHRQDPVPSVSRHRLGLPAAAVPAHSAAAGAAQPRVRPPSPPHLCNLAGSCSISGRAAYSYRHSRTCHPITNTYEGRRD